MYEVGHASSLIVIIIMTIIVVIVRLRVAGTFISIDDIIVLMFKYF